MKVFDQDRFKELLGEALAYQAIRMTDLRQVITEALAAGDDDSLITSGPKHLAASSRLGAYEHVRQAVEDCTIDVPIPECSFPPLRTTLCGVLRDWATVAGALPGTGSQTVAIANGVAQSAARIVQEFSARIRGLDFSLWDEDTAYYLLMLFSYRFGRPGDQYPLPAVQVPDSAGIALGPITEPLTQIVVEYLRRVKELVSNDTDEAIYRLMTSMAYQICYTIGAYREHIYETHGVEDTMLLECYDGAFGVTGNPAGLDLESDIGGDPDARGLDWDELVEPDPAPALVGHGYLSDDPDLPKWYAERYRDDDHQHASW